MQFHLVSLVGAVSHGFFRRCSFAFALDGRLRVFTDPAAEVEKVSLASYTCLNPNSSLIPSLNNPGFNSLRVSSFEFHCLKIRNRSN